MLSFAMSHPIINVNKLWVALKLINGTKFWRLPAYKKHMYISLVEIICCPLYTTLLFEYPMQVRKFLQVILLLKAINQSMTKPCQKKVQKVRCFFYCKHQCSIFVLLLIWYQLCLRNFVINELRFFRIKPKGCYTQKFVISKVLIQVPYSRTFLQSHIGYTYCLVYILDLYAVLVQLNKIRFNYRRLQPNIFQMKLLQKFKYSFQLPNQLVVS
eukprot:TRINITY_DN262_c0_g1_i1.p1 TRINITY_DN262_c0_g1~~TRINITY_DN262_c0_g1_i1.p1  ORF type:complete len:213 (+),score=-21.16 TRINITY_DN262_c0_g1_i1:115-753(+)